MKLFVERVPFGQFLFSDLASRIVLGFHAETMTARSDRQLIYEPKISNAILEQWGLIATAKVYVADRLSMTTE